MPPETGFETSGGTEWTSLADEAQFYADVVAASSRTSWVEVGRSVNDRPIRAVTVGSGPVGPMFVGLMHGTEPAGREAELMLLRDLALTDDPDLVAYLAANTVAFVPTMNPDGLVHTSLDGEGGTRENANGVDLNRDNLLSWKEPETLALARTLAWFRPQIILDAHEQRALSGIDELEFDWCRNLNVHEDLYDLGRGLVETTVAGALTAEGYSNQTYPWATDLLGNPVVLNNVAGLRHAAGVQTETRRRQDSAQKRVDIQRLVMDTVVDWHADNRAVLTAAVIAAQAHRPSTMYLDGADNVAPSVEVPRPYGYKLTESQRTATVDHRTAFSLAGGEVVPLDQPQWAAVAYMLDKESTTFTGSGGPAVLPIVEATRMMPLSIRVGGLTRPVAGVRVNGVTRTAIGVRERGVTRWS